MKTFRKLHRLLRQESVAFIPIFLKNYAKYIINQKIFQKETAIQKIHGMKMKLNLTDKGISRTLFLLQNREKEHYYLLQQIIKPGQRILDLGANIGYYVLLESQLLGNNGEIIAVEPHPENFKLLTENTKLNNLKNVTPIHAAVAEQDGTTTLHLSKLSNVHSLLEDTISNTAGKSIKVSSRSIATLVEQFGHIDLIRMDIEGYEQQIFQSLIELNHNQQVLPTILFELHTKKYDTQTFLETINTLFGLGYRFSFLANSNTNTIKESGAKITTSIPTDGKIRHIIKNPTAPQVEQLLLSSRCAVLTTQA